MKLKVIIAKSRSSRYGRPKYIAFSTMIQSSVEDAMTNLRPRGRYSLQLGTLTFDTKQKKEGTK